MTEWFWVFLLLGMALSTLAGAFVVRLDRTIGWGVITAVLSAYVIGATILVPRFIELNLGLPFILAGGSVIWPFTSQITDMSNEIYGRRKTYIAAIVAYGATLLFITFTLMSEQVTTVMWDAQHEAFWREYHGVGLRVLIGSIIAYTTSQFANVWVFGKLKERLLPGERTLGQAVRGGFVRSWTSDVLTTVIENPLFYVIALYGTMPNEILLSLIGTAMAVKLIVGHLNQPFYIGFRALVQGVRRDM